MPYEEIEPMVWISMLAWPVFLAAAVYGLYWLIPFRHGLLTISAFILVFCWSALNTAILLRGIYPLFIVLTGVLGLASLLVVKRVHVSAIKRELRRM